MPRIVLSWPYTCSQWEGCLKLLHCNTAVQLLFQHMYRVYEFMFSSMVIGYIIGYKLPLGPT